MTTIFEKNGRVFLGARAHILDDSTMTAWAERHVRSDRDLKWIIGNYIEAERANDNGYIFPLESMAQAQTGIVNKPFNMLHQQKYIVGSYAGAQVVDGDGNDLTADASDGTVIVEALAGMWHNHFPEEFALIERAHHEGNFFYSMECTPQTITCPEEDCGKTFDFMGATSELYCEHTQGRVDPKRLDNPQFHGGAAIVPPVRPGWKGAHSKELLSLLDHESDEQLEVMYASIATEFPHLSSEMWEDMMAQVVALAS